MSKRKRLLYRITTAWLALGMLSTGIVQLIPLKEEVQMMTLLGYPSYLLTIIGTWKILGVVAILIPGYALLKEWAYAGFFFVSSGAVCSHFAVNDAASAFIGSVLLLTLTFASWYLRPATRKMMANPQ